MHGVILLITQQLLLSVAKRAAGRTPTEINNEKRARAAAKGVKMYLCVCSLLSCAGAHKLGMRCEKYFLHCATRFFSFCLFYYLISCSPLLIFPSYHFQWQL